MTEQGNGAKCWLFPPPCTPLTSSLHPRAERDVVTLSALSAAPCPILLLSFSFHKYYSPVHLFTSFHLSVCYQKDTNWNTHLKEEDHFTDTETALWAEIQTQICTIPTSLSYSPVQQGCVWAWWAWHPATHSPCPREVCDLLDKTRLSHCKR